MYQSFLLSAALLSAPVLAAQVPASFVDPLSQAAQMSPLAARAPVNGLAWTGAKLVAVGQRGHILVGDGNSWKQANVPASVDLTSVFFANRESGWAVGHDGLILHSDDGGAHWSRQSDGRVGATVDDRPLLDVWFANPREGLAVGAFGLVRCTDNGGAQWVDCKDSVDNPQGLHLNAIRAIDGALYVTGEQGMLLRRKQGEARFTQVKLPYRGSLFGITGDHRQLIVYGLRGNAWRSTDGGANWLQLDMGGLRSGIAAGVRTKEGGFVLLAQSGQMLYSADGSSFTNVPIQRIDPVTAAIADAGADMVLAGVRGVRLQSVPGISK